MRVKRIGVIALCLLAMAVASTAQENKDNKDKEKKDHELRRSVTEILDHTIMNLEEELVPAAEAMPEDKFGFAPTNGEFKGVRTYGQQIKHIAAVNFELAAAILQEKPPEDINAEAGPTSITTKEDVLKYLKDSFKYAHKAVQTINEKNEGETVRSPFGEGKVSRLGLACSISWHGYDHYGQMVVYLRMNGIIPPASR